MVKTPAEVFANLSDAQTALKIALPVGSESAIWKRGERGEAKSKSTPLMIWKGASEDTRYSCGHGRPLAQRGRKPQDEFAFGVGRRLGIRVGERGLRDDGFNSEIKQRLSLRTCPHLTPENPHSLTISHPFNAGTRAPCCTHRRTHLTPRESRQDVPGMRRFGSRRGMASFWSTKAKKRLASSSLPSTKNTFSIGHSFPQHSRLKPRVATVLLRLLTFKNSRNT